MGFSAITLTILFLVFIEGPRKSDNIVADLEATLGDCYTEFEDLDIFKSVILDCLGESRTGTSYI